MVWEFSNIVLGPDVNESYRKFTVNKDGAIRFGMAGNLIYRHRNLFRGAEDFELKFKGAMEFIANPSSDFNMTKK